MSGRWLRLPCDPSIYDINSCFRAAYQHERFSVLICVVANARAMTLPFLGLSRFSAGCRTAKPAGNSFSIC